MSAMYQDAKEWLRDQVENGMSAKDLIGFICGYVDNDDIEYYFGVSMESNEDNPGSEVCPICGDDSENNDVCDYCAPKCPRCDERLDHMDERDMDDHDMCFACWITLSIEVSNFWSDFFYDLSVYCTNF